MNLFNLFARPSRPVARRRTVLSVLTLDDRTVPSGTPVGGVSPIPIGNGGGPMGEGATRTLSITEFNCEEISPGWIVLSGRVSGENVGGLTVTFSGTADSIHGRTCVTNADGTFALAIRVQTDGSDSGTVYAVASDGQGLTSNTAEVYVDPTPG